MAAKKPFPPKPSGKKKPAFDISQLANGKGKPKLSKAAKNKARAAAIARMAATNPSDKPPSNIQKFLKQNGQ